MLVQNATAAPPNAFPPVFAGLVPVLQDDDTIAIYGVSDSGSLSDQPLVVDDAGVLQFFAAALGRTIQAAR